MKSTMINFNAYSVVFFSRKATGNHFFKEKFSMKKLKKNDKNMSSSEKKIDNEHVFCFKIFIYDSVPETRPN